MGFVRDGACCLSITILNGDARVVLAKLAEESVQCCVTSPPYFGLRDYGVEGQLGLELTPDDFIAEMVGVFRLVRRVLRSDGTLWLNIGDSYAASGRGGNPPESIHQMQRTNRGSVLPAGLHEPARTSGSVGRAWSKAPPGYKNKDLIGIPWMLAFALRSDGWYLRSDIIWHKPNPMPESVQDRPTKSHEYLFLLSKSERYLYNADAIREPLAPSTYSTFGNIRSVKTESRGDYVKSQNFAHSIPERRPRLNADGSIAGANKRSVWTVATQPFKGAHFATFPPALIEPCIRAGSNVGDVVLDPFGGAGTTGLVAHRLGRAATLIELNPEYCAIAQNRIRADAPLFVDGVA
ncbi:MAG: DNA-methyltransferase [Gemmatimonas sp.]